MGLSRSRGYENDTNVQDANGLPPHSIAFVVEGGDPQTIANTIALKKGPGCGTFGDIAVDTRDKHGTPCIISFFRPQVLSIAVSIRIKPLPGYLSVTGEAMRRNIAEYLNSLRIGDDVLLSKLYTPINTAEPQPGLRTFDVLHLGVGVKGQEQQTGSLVVQFNHVVLCAVEDITLQEY